MNQVDEAIAAFENFLFDIGGQVHFGQIDSVDLATFFLANLFI